MNSPLHRPLITEKATALNALGQYVFMVAPQATKPEVKKAVQKLYGVHVESVAMIAPRTKQRRYRNSISVRHGYKKAVVRLRAGEKIDRAA